MTTHTSSPFDTSIRLLQDVETPQRLRHARTIRSRRHLPRRPAVLGSQWTSERRGFVVPGLGGPGLYKRQKLVRLRILQQRSDLRTGEY
jgi:hypothetical protein